MHSLTAFYLNQTVNFPCLFFSCDYCTKSELSFDQMDDQDLENYWQHWLDKEEAALAREEDHKDDTKTVVRVESHPTFSRSLAPNIFCLTFNAFFCSMI